MDRPTKDEYFLEIAETVSKRATCPRRQVGCVIVDSEGHIASTGYNGVPRGFPHCIDPDTRCEGASYPSGEGLEKCLATHAEINALIQLKSEDKNLTAYFNNVTPCVTCAKAICNSNIRRIVARGWYAHKDVDKMFDTAQIQVDIIGKEATNV